MKASKISKLTTVCFLMGIVVTGYANTLCIRNGDVRYVTVPPPAGSGYASVPLAPGKATVYPDTASGTYNIVENFSGDSTTLSYQAGTTESRVVVENQGGITTDWISHTNCHGL